MIEHFASLILRLKKSRMSSDIQNIGHLLGHACTFMSQANWNYFLVTRVGRITHTDVTVCTLPASCTVTRVHVHEVITGGAVLTRITGAFVEI